MIQPSDHPEPDHVWSGARHQRGLPLDGDSHRLAVTLRGFEPGCKGLRMADGRLTSRMAGLLKARLPDLKLEEVEDPRSLRGRRWQLDSLLTAMVVAMAAGRRSLVETEALTEEMSPALRRGLGIGRRAPDTTMRDVLEEVLPSEVRAALRRQVKAAHRRKSLPSEGLPFGVVAMDGKSVTVQAWDDFYAQRHRHSEGAEAVGLLRTMTCTLISSGARPCIEMLPIPADTNEMGQLGASLEVLDKAYGHTGLFRMVTYDSGGCSEENAAAVRAHGWDYLLAIKGNQPQILETLQRKLGGKRPHEALCETVDVLSNHRTVTRRLYLFEGQPLYRWSHARTFLRVESETVEDGRVTTHEDRYYVCSLARAGLTDEQWLLLVRRHWGVEVSHNLWDTAFAEDDKPWIKTHPRAAAVLMVLRRIAYNLLTLFRWGMGLVQERSARWKDVMRWLYNAALCVTQGQLDALRPRATATS